ncbi:hypothetical protein A0H81_06328 [Grifola frondosa]|uniref:Fungal-type protein kinase domain-containing protein n=1 Tax=Grifola frondosa TaxID=5627 RepID=A0A1C7MBF9_GRIFR|nr:hypothetical protein A0H81_06328 [Grifola frondosa]
MFRADSRAVSECEPPISTHPPLSSPDYLPRAPSNNIARHGESSNNDKPTPRHHLSMKNVPAYSAASDGTHSTYTIRKGPSGCAKVSHHLFLDSMIVQSVASPYLQGDVLKIPDDEISVVDLQLIFCEAITDNSYDEQLCSTDVGLYKAGEAPTDGRTYWDRQRMWLEFRKKSGNSVDPFSGEEGDEVRALVLEQLRAYAETAMDHEHRTHIYSVLVLYKFARLIRWDRSGAIITDKFDYKAHPEILGEFFWRFAHMTDEAQGYDPTAQLANPNTELYRFMDEMAEKKLDEQFDYIREAFKKSLDGGCLRFKLFVEDKANGTRYFVVGKPQQIASGVASDGTRSYVAIDVEKEETPERLRKASTRVDSDDVERHPPSKLVHYRLVEKEVGKPLGEFNTSRNLVKLIYDCLIAHQDAVNLARVLHRDVSSRSLLMYPIKVANKQGLTRYMWTGLLNDWELSKPIAKPGAAEVACGAGRTGTWQFTSANILNNKSRRPTIQDESESFFYVLIYYGVRYLKHNCTAVESFVSRFFDSYTFENGEYSCGEAKMRMLEGGVIKGSDNTKLAFTGDGLQPHPLDKLIDKVPSWFQGRYYMMDREHERRQQPSGNTHAPNEEEDEYDGLMENPSIENEHDDDEEESDVDTMESLEGIARRKRAYAAKLDGHHAMCELLRIAIKDKSRWPVDDKFGDQLLRRSKNSTASTGGKWQAQDILAGAQLRKHPKAVFTILMGEPFWYVFTGARRVDANTWKYTLLYTFFHRICKRSSRTTESPSFWTLMISLLLPRLQLVSDGSSHTAPPPPISYLSHMAGWTRALPYPVGGSGHALAKCTDEAPVDAPTSPTSLLDSMLVQSDTVLPRHPSYKEISCMIPDDEVSAVDLQLIFCEAITDNSVCPGYVLHPCATEFDSYDEQLCSADVGLYKAGEAPTDGRTYWDRQRMWLDFRKKGSSSADPFSDEEGDEVRALVLEQLRAYAETAMDHEHRTHLYSVLVLHKFARLIRWDRSGAVVTDKFNYKAHPEILEEFFWRFAHMTEEAQGYDPTAQLVGLNTELYRLMDDMAEKKLEEPFDYIREAFKESLDGDCLRYKLSVEDKVNGTRYFLVGKPQQIAAGTASRGTRSYVAIDMEKKEFVHLKDHWRISSDVTDESDEEQQDKEDNHPLRTGGPHLEGDILAYLNKTGVRNVPTVLCHGDVAGQVTVTQDIWKRIPRTSSMNSYSRFDPPSELVHYRLAEKEVCKSLSEFKTSSNLVRLIYDCTIAHEDAMNLGRILHRDISAGNMLMYPVPYTMKLGITIYIWTGLLNDWAFSKPITKLGVADVARRASRTGTWQFMSARILNNKSRHQRSKMNSSHSSMSSSTTDYTVDNGEYTCGQSKIRTMEVGTINVTGDESLSFTGIPSHPHPLNKLIDTMLSWFQGHYFVAKYERRLRASSNGSSTASQDKLPDSEEDNLLEDDQFADVLDDYRRKSTDQTLEDLESLELASKAAANLEDHSAMRELFLEALWRWLAT